MRNRKWLLIGLLTLLAALSVHGQSRTIRANIPFAFGAAGKQFPAGQYDLATIPSGQAIRLTSEDGKNSTTIMILTRTAGAMHNTPADAHLVFDQVRESFVISELWLPGADGYLLNTLKDQHEHRVVDVPVR